MSVENLATLPENVASVLDLVVWVLEAGAGAHVQAQGPVAAQVTVPAGMVLLYGHLLDHCNLSWQAIRSFLYLVADLLLLGKQYVLCVYIG
jgi:hypothetical protein